MKAIVLLFSVLFLCGCGSTGSDAGGASEDYEHPTVTATKAFLQFHQGRNQQVMRDLTAARASNDYDKAAALLSARATELRAALNEVNAGILSGRLHKDDFALLTTPLEEELAWATAGSAVLR